MPGSRRCPSRPTARRPQITSHRTEEKVRMICNPFVSKRKWSVLFQASVCFVIACSDDSSLVRTITGGAGGAASGTMGSGVSTGVGGTNDASTDVSGGSGGADGSTDQQSDSSVPMYEQDDPNLV